MHHDLKLPVAEVAGVVHHTCLPGHRLLDTLRALHIDQLHHLIRAHRVEVEQLDDMAAEVVKRRTEQLTALPVSARRKRRPQIVDRQLAATTVQDVEEPTQHVANYKTRPTRQRARQRTNQSHRQEFDSVAHAVYARACPSCSPNHTRKISAGSTDTVSGTQTIGNANGA